MDTATPDLTPRTTADAARNADPGELAKFDALASRWWDAQGEFKVLHAMNPLRANFIDQRSPVAGRQALDIGCGGGLLCEALARRGAQVCGIDLSGKALEVAELHRAESELDIHYAQASAEQWADEHAGRYDIVACMELLEHVPEPRSLVAASAALAKPGGQLYFSTINRTPRAWLLGIVGAEYLLNLLPRGTHAYDRLVRPHELSRWMRQAGVATREIAGWRYNPLNQRCALSGDVSVNYIVHGANAVGAAGAAGAAGGGRG